MERATHGVGHTTASRRRRRSSKLESARDGRRRSGFADLQPGKPPDEIARVTREQSRAIGGERADENSGHRLLGGLAEALGNHVGVPRGMGPFGVGGRPRLDVGNATPAR